ncbi:MAG: hypothetical protein RLZZ210_639 [Pseudomonadota bacterium]|jgi:hypothetical protein
MAIKIILYINILLLSLANSCWANDVNTNTNTNTNLNVSNINSNNTSPSIANIKSTSELKQEPILLNIKPMKYSGSEYLKNYALSSCISNGYDAHEVVRDSTAVASGYLELGSLPIEAYNEVANLGKQFLDAEYQSITSEKLILMKCIDFYHSKPLSNIIKKYAKKIYKKKSKNVYN